VNKVCLRGDDQVTDLATPLAAGWYSDPHGRAVQRYWNGAAWTPYVVDASGQQQTEESVAPASVPGASAGDRSIVIQNVMHAAPAPAISFGVVGQAKSMATAVVLTVLFGPLGLFYVNVGAAAVLLVITFVTLGLGALVTYPLAIILAITGTNKHNAQVVAAMSSSQPIYSTPASTIPAAPPMNIAPPPPALTPPTS
jgi:hypothetical protein